MRQALEIITGLYEVYKQRLKSVLVSDYNRGYKAGMQACVVALKEHGAQL